MGGLNGRQKMVAAHMRGRREERLAPAEELQLEVGGDARCGLPTVALVVIWGLVGVAVLALAAAFLV